jgi:DNA modification methylase
MKPIALIENALLNSSQRGDIILDLFGGSGSTLIASEKTGRACRMMELSEHYVDVIIHRWQDFTGDAATLEGDGRTFSEIAAERG